MKFPNPKMLLHIAMADAFGMGAEYLKLPDDQEMLNRVLQFDRYIEHPRHSPGAGRYSDDTEMSIANTQVLLDHVHPSIVDFANAYVREFEYGGRRKGYSKGFQTIMEKVRTGTELLAAVRADSEKNGAAMRAVPFGVFADKSLMFDVTTTSAEVTHATDVGRFGSRAVALASHFSLYTDEPFTRLRAYLLDFLPSADVDKYRDIIQVPWADGPVVGGARGPVGLTTVAAVITLLESNYTFMDVLRSACRLGGDVDSVAAIACGVCSARCQAEELPDFLEFGLEFGSPKTGSERLRTLSRNLMVKFGGLHV